MNEMKEVLEQLEELMGENFQQLLDVYLNDTRQRLDKLQLCIRQGDMECVKKLAHAIKGSSRNLGAEALASLCEQCEEAALHPDTAELMDLHSQASAVFEDVCAVIKSISPGG